MSSTRRESGPTWVLLHGTPLRPEVWDEVARFLPRGCSVQAPDLEPGPDLADPVSDLSARVVAALPDEGDVHLVGHSFGGQVAIQTALDRSDRITSLTLLCSRDTPYPRFRAAAEAMVSGVPIDVAGTLSRWFRPDEVASDGPAVRLARDCVRTVDPRRWARCLSAIAEFDRSAQMSALPMPVHSIAAELDTVSTVEAMTAMTERIPRGRLSVWPDASHMSAFLQPRRLAELLNTKVDDPVEDRDPRATTQPVHWL